MSINKKAKIFIIILSVFNLLITLPNAMGAENLARTITVGDGSGTINSLVEIPITISGPSDGGKVGGVAFTLIYDNTKLEFMDTATTDNLVQTEPAEIEIIDPVAESYCGLESCVNPYDENTYGSLALNDRTLMYQYNDVVNPDKSTENLLKIAGATAQEIEAGGSSTVTLFKIKFKILTSETAVYPLKIENTTILNPNAGYPTATAISAVVGMPSMTMVEGGYPAEDTFIATLVDGSVENTGGSDYPDGDFNGNYATDLQDVSKAYGVYRNVVTITEMKGNCDFNFDGTIGLPEVGKLYNCYKNSMTPCN